MAMAMVSGAITSTLSAIPQASFSPTPCPSLGDNSRSWSLPLFWPLHLATECGSSRLQTGSRRRGEVRAAKGFGDLLQKKKKGAGAEVEARFSAYARNKVDYVVRTTHPDNPDFRGKDELAADVRSTCEQLRFTRLEILESESTSDDEAFVSFRVTYAVAKRGRAGDKQFLVEKSRFVKAGDRWLYIERIPTSQASEAAWLNSTTPNFVNPKLDRKSFKSQPGLLPRKS